MRKSFFLLSIIFISQKLSAQYIMHEWGTFTTVAGTDGVLLPGLFLEEETLPLFVYSHKGFSPHPIYNVDLKTGDTTGYEYQNCDNTTVKMETPVMYFYNTDSMNVKVRVDFPDGRITQWYPNRTAGEKYSEYFDLNKSVNKNGWIEWNTNILAKGVNIAYSPPTWQETKTWTTPRKTTSNLITVNGEVEKFLFYRGIGNFTLPVVTKFTKEGNLMILNNSVEEIPYFYVYEKLPDNKFKLWFTGAIKSGESETISKPTQEFDVTELDSKLIEFQSELESAGLYSDEAVSMLNTWKQSYFGKTGLRIFWILTENQTKKILPLTLTPKASKVSRVLVARSEVLTPEFEKEIFDDYTKGTGGTKYENDRYHLAYHARVDSLISQGFSGIQNGKSGTETLLLSPNPANDILNLKLRLKEAGHIELRMTDIAGRTILNISDTGNETYNTTINLAGLESGLYFLKLYTKQGQYVRKIIKQ